MLRFVLALLAILVSFNPVWAEVNPKNGNFHVSYTDLSFDGQKGGKLEVTRTYNSKSKNHGLFGNGWGSALETLIRIGAHGTPVNQANGTGARFYSEPVQEQEYYKNILAQNIEKIVEQHRIDLAKSLTGQELKQELSQFRSKIENNQITRNYYWDKFVREGRVDVPEVKLGHRFEAYCGCSFGKRKFTRTLEGYRLEYGNTRETFNTKGQLVRIEDDDGTVEIIRSKDSGDIQRLKVQGKTIHVFLDHKSRVDRLLYRGQDETLKTALYGYDSDGNLVLSKDSAGNVHRFSYDASHNMRSITYDDDSTLQIHYTEGNFFASTIHQRDGSLVQYTYGGESDLNYWTEIRHFTADQVLASNNDPKQLEPNKARRERREWRLRPDALGRLKNEWMSFASSPPENDTLETRRELFFDKDGLLKEAVTYSELFPSGSMTEFTWDDAGRVAFRKNQDWTESFIYASADGTDVSVYAVKRHGAETELKFEYQNGQIVRVEGVKVELALSYDKNFPEKLKSLGTSHTRLEITRDNEGVPVSMLVHNADQTDKLRIETRGNNSVRLLGNTSAAASASGAIQGLLRLLAPINKTIEVF